MAARSVRMVSMLAEKCKELPQKAIATKHLFHAGTYARTITIARNTMLTGALIKRATVVILSGDVIVYLGDESIRLQGYNVLPASAGRKQAYLALADTTITMLFATNAKTVEEAEQEFTDEYDSLLSHSCENEVVITGE